ncbi:MAG: hypothetical protein Kow0054_22900 [Deferrisoma sp.]
MRERKHGAAGFLPGRSDLIPQPVGPREKGRPHGAALFEGIRKGVNAAHPNPWERPPGRDAPLLRAFGPDRGVYAASTTGPTRPERARRKKEGLFLFASP